MPLNHGEQAAAHILSQSNGRWRLQSLEPIDTGHVAKVFRANVRERGTQAPFSVIVKIQSNDTRLDQQFNSYLREWHFYKSVRGTVLARTPHPFFLTDTAEAAGGILILEDLAPHGQWLGHRNPSVGAVAIDPKTRPQEREKREATQKGVLTDPHLGVIESLAALHASPIKASLVPYQFNDNIEQLGPLHPKEKQLMVHLLGEAMAGTFAEQVTRPVLDTDSLEVNHFALIHCDARLGNILPQLGYPMIDWGDYCWGPPAFDLAYFLATEPLSEPQIHQCLTHYLEERHRLAPFRWIDALDTLITDVRAYLPLVARTPTLLLSRPISSHKTVYWQSMLKRTGELWLTLKPE